MKLISSFAAAVALAALVLFSLNSPTTATAGHQTSPQHSSSHKPPKHKHHHHHHKHHPYPGSVDTKCDYSAPGSVKTNHAYNVKYAVKAHGNARPSGVVKFSVYRYNNGHWEFVRSVSRNYTGPSSMSLGSFSNAGNYSTTMSFKPSPGSVYEQSSSSRSFRVH
jgi:hypothetical protein